MASSKERKERALASAEQDLQNWSRAPLTPQTRSPAYRLAFDDRDLLLRDEMRGVRLQLELTKPELVLEERQIRSTIVIFGSSRIPEPGTTPKNVTKAVSERLGAKTRYYEEARKFAFFASIEAIKQYGQEFVVVSGGGPGIMEAANRGASDVGAPSIGFNIVLPHEQAPNRYITPELCFQFHYFAIRKMHFLMRAKALAFFPGGFGTLDELFEVLCLIQTRKIDPIPVLLFGAEFWDRLIDFDVLVEEGTISPEDAGLVTRVETAEDGWNEIVRFYDGDGLTRRPE